MASCRQSVSRILNTQSEPGTTTEIDVHGRVREIAASQFVDSLPPLKIHFSIRSQYERSARLSDVTYPSRNLSMAEKP